jgi:predicted RNase H-like nuclease (RuvC/YqgF family)
MKTILSNFEDPSPEITDTNLVEYQETPEVNPIIEISNFISEKIRILTEKLEEKEARFLEIDEEIMTLDLEISKLENHFEELIESSDIKAPIIINIRKNHKKLQSILKKLNEEKEKISLELKTQFENLEYVENNKNLTKLDKIIDKIKNTTEKIKSYDLLLTIISNIENFKLKKSKLLEEYEAIGLKYEEENNLFAKLVEISEATNEVINK